MPAFVNDAVPQLLGVPLVRFSPQYNAMTAIRPQIKHDFSASRGKSVSLDKYKRWGDRGWTKNARRRDKLSLIGTANSEGLSKTQVEIRIDEYTGPSTPDGQASTLWLTKEDMLYARTQLWEYGKQAFHESIGSANLADDYQGFIDRIHLLELMNTTVKLNPSNKADNQALVTDRITTADLDRIRWNLSTRNTPRFRDTGCYHALIDETFMVHLMQDPTFLQYAIAQIQGGQIPLNQTPFAQAPQAGNAVVQGQVNQMITTPSVPIIYRGFCLWTSNNIPKRTVNSLEASLGLFFGPDSVGLGGGGRGVEIALHNDTDFNRHFRFIWTAFMDVKYLLDDDSSTGCAVEARTFGGV